MQLKDEISLVKTEISTLESVLSEQGRPYERPFNEEQFGTMSLADLKRVAKLLHELTYAPPVRR